LRRFLKIVSAEQAREMDEKASREYGVNPELLMEDAGSAVYEVARREYGLDKNYLVVAGTGNNGGDALVAARRLYSAGAKVSVVVVGELEKLAALAARNLELLKNMGVSISNVVDEASTRVLEDLIHAVDVLIVGLFGIGLRGEIKDYRRRVVELINNSGKPVVSVDIASGINPDNGRVEGIAVRSSVTVTFGLPKYGNILYPGAYYCGKLYVSRLSYPPSLLDSGDIRVELNYPLQPPERVKWGHKGVFGKYLLIAGSRYYYGAPYYASQSFLAVGGGYVRLAAPKSIIPALASKSSEVVYIPMEETSDGSISYSNLDYILGLVEEAGVDIIAVGPGLSTNRETMELVVKVVENVKMPVIVDGDGLTALSGNIEVLKKRLYPTILTPHPGEFSRLTGMSVKEIEENPIRVVQEFARGFNTYLVLKTARSLIAYPDGRTYVNLTGNPGMAKAGMGDVLVGVIAGIYGVGLRDPGASLRMGVLVHGLAGDLAAEIIGEDGVTPDLVLDNLPHAMRIIRGNPGYVIGKYFPIEL
jgi:NAD(P)H-hydrate epimerase